MVLASGERAIARMGGFTPGVSRAPGLLTADTGEGPGSLAMLSSVLGAAPAVADMIVVPTPPLHVPAALHDTVFDEPIQYTVPS